MSESAILLVMADASDNGKKSIDERLVALTRRLRSMHFANHSEDGRIEKLAASVDKAVAVSMERTAAISALAQVVEARGRGFNKSET